MPQHDMVVANDTAPAVRADLNNALAALAQLSSGVAAPPTTYPNMLWYDSSNNMLMMRNEADSAWIELFTLDQVANAAAAAVGGTLGTIENITPVAGDVMWWDGSAWVALALSATNTDVLRSNGSAPYWGKAVITANNSQLIGSNWNQTDGAWIAGNYSTRAAGNIGTLALLRNTGRGSDAFVNNQVAGSSLKWSSAGSSFNNTAPSGTWRCLGFCEENTNSTADDKVTLWQRIS